MTGCYNCFFLMKTPITAGHMEPLWTVSLSPTFTLSDTCASVLKDNAQAKNIQCQVTIWMFYFSSKNGISKVGVQRMGRGKHIFLTQKEQAPSLFILCRKKKWKHRSNHIFLKEKNGENKHNAPNYRRTVQTHTLPSTHSKLQSHPDLRWTHSSQ